MLIISAQFQDYRVFFFFIHRTLNSFISNLAILFQHIFRTSIYLIFLILFERILLVLSLNESNKSLASTDCIFVWESSFQLLKLYFDTRWSNVHPRLRFTAIDRSQNPGKHPKRNHCCLYTKYNKLIIPVSLSWVTPHNNKINIYWVFTIAKHYSKSFACIMNSFNHYITLRSS